MSKLTRNTIKRAYFGRSTSNQSSSTRTTNRKAVNRHTVKSDDSSASTRPYDLYQYADGAELRTLRGQYNVVASWFGIVVGSFPVNQVSQKNSSAVLVVSVARKIDVLKSIRDDVETFLGFYKDTDIEYSYESLLDAVDEAIDLYEGIHENLVYIDRLVNSFVKIDLNVL